MEKRPLLHNAQLEISRRPGVPTRGRMQVIWRARHEGNTPGGIQQGIKIVDNAARLFSSHPRAEGRWAAKFGPC